MTGRLRLRAAVYNVRVYGVLHVCDAVDVCRVCAHTRWRTVCVLGCAACGQVAGFMLYGTAELAAGQGSAPWQEQACRRFRIKRGGVGAHSAVVV